MSHSAHRFGTETELKGDYVVFVRPARGIDDIDARTRAQTLRKTKKLAEVLYSFGPVNFGRTGAGCTGQGKTYEEIMTRNELNGFMSVFTHKETVKRVLGELKKLDAGFSVVASGLTGDIFEICKAVGLKPHTTLFSLGIWGKTELLPSDEHLKITTLCGHSMVSPAMIDHYVAGITKGTISPEDAAKKLAKTCPCGIYNLPRTVEQLKRLTLPAGV